MSRRRSPLAPLAACALWAASSAAADRPAMQQITHTGPAGMWIETICGPAGVMTQPAPEVGERGNVIWHLHDDDTVASSICLADTMDETWLGQSLNYERLTYLQTTGDGTPIYEYDLLPYNPINISVASAEDISLGVISVQRPEGTPATVLAFNSASGTTPIWTYTFDSDYEVVPQHSVDVSVDGTLVAALSYANAQPKSMIVILDGATGAELNEWAPSAYVTAIELSDDGSRAVLTEGSTARVIETSGMTTLHSFTVSGTGGTARLSRNGLVAAAGGFNCRAYRDTGSGWSSVWYQYEADQWFGTGIGLSGDGNTLFSVSHNYAGGYLDLTYRVIDLVSSTELARTTTSGTGSFQDSVKRAQVSDNGEVLAVVSWGTEDNAHPEVQVFDRDANLIGSIDTPGSPYDLDMSRDGRYLVTGGKAVHANTFGRGADAYAYEVYSFCFGDLDGDDDVDLSDLAELLGNYGTTSGATYEDGDLDDDGDVDLSDLAALLGVYGNTCD